MSKERKIFLRKLFAFLETEQYLLLKYIEPSLNQIEESSDLDILLADKNWKKIEALAKQDDSVCKLSRFRQHSMCQLFLHFKDGGFLQIDCLHKLVRKDLIYLTNDYLFAQERRKGAVKTYSNFCLLEHLVLFNYLNGSGISDRYINYFQQLETSEQEQIISDFNHKYKTSIVAFKDFAFFSLALRQQLVCQLKQMKVNKGIAQQINIFSYVLGSMISVNRKRGFIMSFSGVDGAGKSTILEATRRLLSQKFRKKTVVLRHRPSLLPILSSFIYGKAKAEQRSMDRLPRQGKNTSTLGSYLRFAYYYLDYLLGQAFVFFKYQMRNYVVLYDRYYFDFIADPRRTNLNLNYQLSKALYYFVQKPSINLFLHAPAEVILDRKQELSKSDVDSLTKTYRSLFEELEIDYEQKYIAIKNIKQEDTMQKISKQIINFI